MLVKAVLWDDGTIHCPCSRQLGDTRYGAYSHGVVIKCPRCKQLVAIEIPAAKDDTQTKG